MLISVSGERYYRLRPSLPLSHKERATDERGRILYREARLHAKFLCVLALSPAPSPASGRGELDCARIVSPLPFMGEGLGEGAVLTQLTVFTGAAVVQTAGLLRFILLALAGDAQAHAGQRFTAGFGNNGITLFAVVQAFPLRQLTAHAGNGIHNAVFNLLEGIVVARPATGHFNSLGLSPPD